MKIVTLLASGTEIVCALGRRDALVGRSHECDYPPEVAALPAVSRPSFPVSGTSRAIDLAIKERLARALSIYEVDEAQLAALAPDVIVTQTQCEVCAVSPADVERAACAMTGRPAEVVALEPNRLDDIWADMRRVADAIDADGDSLVDGLRSRLADLENRVASPATRPTVVAIEWIDPLMAAGNWMPELIELAGGRSALGTAGQHSPWMAWDQVRQANPDVLFVSPCGFTIERTLEEMPKVTAQDGWSDLEAVRTGRVYVADGNAFFHRPGPRIVESAEILAEIFHGIAGATPFEGAGFVRYGPDAHGTID